MGEPALWSLLFGLVMWCAKTWAVEDVNTYMSNTASFDTRRPLNNITYLPTLHQYFPRVD